MLETSSASIPTRPDPGPATTGAPIEEEPGIKLPEIPEFALPNPRGDHDRKKDNPLIKLHQTVNHIQPHMVPYF